MPSLPAYEAYLRYRSYQWQFTREASQRSRECLEQALALDPEFALPYVGLADYHLALATVGGIPAHEAMPRARELAPRALDIDRELPEAHAMLGIVTGHDDFDWGEAERRFRLAAKREPLSPHLRQWYATFWLFATGRASEARLQVARVIEEIPGARCGIACQPMSRKVWASRTQPATIFGRPWSSTRTSGSDGRSWACSVQTVANSPRRCTAQRRPWVRRPGLCIALVYGGRAREHRAGGEGRAAARHAAQRFVRRTSRIPRRVSGPRRHRQRRRMGEEGGRTALPGLHHGPVRPFEPVLRQSAEWPGVLKSINRTPRSE